MLNKDARNFETGRKLGKTKLINRWTYADMDKLVEGIKILG